MINCGGGFLTIFNKEYRTTERKVAIDEKNSKKICPMSLYTGDFCFVVDLLCFHLHPLDLGYCGRVLHVGLLLDVSVR
jgi:hypothetical protein